MNRQPGDGTASAGAPRRAARTDDFARRRGRMVEDLARRGISDPLLLQAFATVPRHLFVDEALAGRAYGDGSLPIGHGQTLSQPYIVARMIAMLDLRPGAKVLEIGTGSGYQSALLSLLAGAVYTIERVGAILDRALDNLRRAGIGHVTPRLGDGTLGWPSEAPFAAILVSAASPSVPAPLLSQLEPGGRLVIPVGGAFGQTLRRLRRTEAGAQVEEGETCRFVRLIGAAGFAE